MGMRYGYLTAASYDTNIYDWIPLFLDLNGPASYYEGATGGILLFTAASFSITQRAICDSGYSIYWAGEWEHDNGNRGRARIGLPVHSWRILDGKAYRTYMGGRSSL